MALTVEQEEKYEHLAAEAAREAIYYDQAALRMALWFTISQEHRRRANEARARARYYRRIARQQDG